MNNMMEKVIRDGSETRRARFNMITSVIGGVLILTGVVLLVIKGLSVEYVDEEGFLQENFFLVPLGFLCMFCGVISFIVVGVKAGVTALCSKFKKNDC